MAKRPTIKDVASAANVSMGTVSRVAANSPAVTEETRARVQEAMRRLGYVPNIAARTMRTNSTKIVGLLIPDLANTVFIQLAKAAERALHASGYTMFLYSSERSTQHVVEVTAITHRRDAIYHDITPGISDEHTLMLAVPQEARLLRTLRQHYQNVTKVAYPKSGTCRFHAYIALKNSAPGQAKNAAAVALGDDLSLKMVVVVDDDVDVLDDSDVLWAMCTRMQADDDINIIRNAMGAILDPSNNNGLTSKMIVDATRPQGRFPERHTFPPEAVKRAQDIVGRIGE